MSTNNAVFKDYPYWPPTTLEHGLSQIEQITRTRKDDIAQINNLKNIYMSGRKVGKIPANAADVVDTDKIGDFNYDDDYFYILTDEVSPSWLRLVSFWSLINLTTDVTGVLPLANGGTNSTDYTAATSTFTNKRITRRVVTMADGTSFTPTGDTADVSRQDNAQALGNLTANAPSGTPTNGQQLEIIIKSTNVQTFIWNAIYDGGATTALPTVTTGGGATDRFYFEYDTTSSKWCAVNVQLGY